MIIRKMHYKPSTVPEYMHKETILINLYKCTVYLNVLFRDIEMAMFFRQTYFVNPLVKPHKTCISSPVHILF